MRQRNKLKEVADNEQVTPSLLLNSISIDTPQVLTFQRVGFTEQDMLPNQYKDSHNNLMGSIKQPVSKDSLTIMEPSSIDFNQRIRKSTEMKSNTKLSQRQQISLNKQIEKMKDTVEEKKKQTCKIIFQKNNILQSIVKSQKIKNLQNNFVKKIQRTSTSRPPVQFLKFKDWQRDSLFYLTGVELIPFIDNIISVLSVFQIFTLTVIYSLSIVFDGLDGSNSVSTLQTASLIFYFIQIIVNFISVKSQAGKKIQFLKDIFLYYLKHNFPVDFVSLLILFIDINTTYSLVSYFRLFIIFKLPQCLDKIQKLQVYFIQNVYNEQYWALVKVFFFNFCYAHIIALFLAAMAFLSTGEESWMTAKGIQDKPWVQQYIWSYYWANTIMLTVGFGDLVANNYQQALCLILIETFSCIMMAYNINCVGGIIANIRFQDQQRSKKFKIFKKLTDNNRVPSELVFQINNYIEESSKMRKKFNYQEDKQFLNQLPVTLKTNYLRQTNKQILKQLVFFKSLLDKTLCNFAEQIQTRISHPQQIIRSIDDDFNLIILRKGRIGYICKKNGCQFNDQIADLIQVKKGETPFLTSLDFISKTRPLYEIKSLQFSVLFTLSYNNFIKTFRQSDMDYQLYCFLRDKIRNIPDQFQVSPCQFCTKFNHFKFTCPRLHYVPYQQHVINKELYKEKVGLNTRRYFLRKKQYNFSPVEYYKKLKDYHTNLNFRFQRDRDNSFNSEQISSQLLKIGNSSDYSSRIVTKKHSENIFSQQIQITLDQRTREVISMEFVRIEKRQNFQDEVWIINCDQMTNYNSYFSQQNPNSLRERFSPQARMSKKMERVQLRQNLSLMNSDNIKQNEFIQNPHSLARLSAILD